MGDSVGAGVIRCHARVGVSVVEVVARPNLERSHLPGGAANRLFGSATTLLYVADPGAAWFRFTATCSTDGGVLIRALRGLVQPFQRLKMSLVGRSSPELQPNGDHRDGDEGWFELWMVP